MPSSPLKLTAQLLTLCLALVLLTIVLSRDARPAQCLPGFTSKDVLSTATLSVLPGVGGTGAQIIDTATGAAVALSADSYVAIERQSDGTALIISDTDIHYWRAGQPCFEPVEGSKLGKDRSYNILSGGFGGVGAEYRYQPGRLTITVYDLTRVADPQNPADGFASAGSRSIRIP